MPSELHEKIIDSYVANGWTVGNFRKKLNVAITAKDEDEVLIGRLGFIPDAFMIEGNTVSLLEVEGLSVIKKEKLRRVVNLWWQLDGRNWFMTLTIHNMFSNAVSYVTDDMFIRAQP